MSAESLNMGVNQLFRLVEEQRSALKQQSVLNTALMGRLESLKRANIDMQEIYMRNDRWINVYRKDANTHVDRISLQLDGVSRNAFELSALRGWLDELECPLAAPCHDPSITLDTLKADLILMEDCLGSDSIVFEEMTLSSYSDTLLFVTSTMDSEVMSDSFYYYMVALMDAVMDPQKEVSAHLKNEYEAKRSDYLLVMEASTSASFFRIAPIILSGSTGRSDTNQQAHGSMDRMFGAVKTRTDWWYTGGTQGLKKFLDQEIGNVFNSAREAIRLNLTGGNARKGLLATEFLMGSGSC